MPNNMTLRDSDMYMYRYRYRYICLPDVKFFCRTNITRVATATRRVTVDTPGHVACRRDAEWPAHAESGSAAAARPGGCGEIPAPLRYPVGGLRTAASFRHRFGSKSEASGNTRARRLTWRQEERPGSGGAGEPGQGGVRVRHRRGRAGCGGREPGATAARPAGGCDAPGVSDLNRALWCTPSRTWIESVERQTRIVGLEWTDSDKQDGLG
jgi:hypothetical protein